MSTPLETLEALKTAAAQHLRNVLGLPEHDCDITPDGQPKPDCGQVFVSVHGGSINNRATEALDEYVDFAVTVTLRMGYLPFDRVKTEGLDYVRKVKAACHKSYDLTALATAASADVVFTEPPMFAGMSDLMVKHNDWFFAEDRDDPDTGIAYTLNFHRARRIRYNTDLDAT